MSLDLDTVEPSLAGPRAAAGSRGARNAAHEFAVALIDIYKKGDDANKRARIEGTEHSIGHGDVVIAAITSCTNTSNPNVMIGAGLVAKNAVERGLKVRPWVKTSLAPGSQVVTDYLAKAGLNKLSRQARLPACRLWLHHLHRQFRAAAGERRRSDHVADLVTAAVLSGNRNFEGRVHPQVRANYLASPMLVVAYALAGSINIDLTKEPVGYDTENEPVYLKDIWPSPKEIADTIRKAVKASSFRRATAMSSTAMPTGRRSRRPRARPMSGRSARPM